MAARASAERRGEAKGGKKRAEEPAGRRQPNADTSTAEAASERPEASTGPPGEPVRKPTSMKLTKLKCMVQR